MAGNIFGKNFRISTWGESHGLCIGCIIDGCPSGLKLTEADIQPFLDRRHGPLCPDKRSEPDKVRILSGVFNGVTLGTAISILIENTDVRSEDYDELKDLYRPGHADFTYDAKYGIRDWRGGGRASGRETAARIAAGAVAMKILGSINVTVNGQLLDLEDLKRKSCPLSAGEIPSSADRMQLTEEEILTAEDSYGAVIEILIQGMPAGIGEPVFDKLDAVLSSAVMSLGAIKAVEIGSGFKSAFMSGSECNDEYINTYCPSDSHESSAKTAHEILMENCRRPGKHFISKKSNNCGGISGGISDGDEIILRAYVKPTPSVSLPQETIDKDGLLRNILIKGRHDQCIGPKALEAAKAMCAISLVDLLFENMHSRMDDFLKIYASDH